MNPRRLLIASPAKGGLPTHYLLLHDNLLRQPLPGWEIEWLVECSNSLLNISRNIIANEAKVKGYELLMMDTDHPVTREHIIRILSHDPVRYPIVSGLYSIKRPGNPFWLGIREKGSIEDENGLLPAAFVPTGFLRISNAALQQIAAFHKDREVYIQDSTLLPPNTAPANGVMTEMFPYGAQGPRTPTARLKRVRKAMETVFASEMEALTKDELMVVLRRIAEALTAEGTPGFLTGEDYTFALLARQAGLGVFIDTHLVCPHEGKITFPITDASVIATTCNPIPEYVGSPDEW